MQIPRSDASYCEFINAVKEFSVTLLIVGSCQCTLEL